MRCILLAGMLAFPAVGYAQSLDEGTLVIRSGGREIGREEYVLRGGRTGGADGTTITTRSRFPSVAPALTQEAIVERRADGSFISLQLNRDHGGRTSRFLAEIGARNVLRIHGSSGGSESVQEFPGRDGIVALADSSFALYLAVVPLATAEGRSLLGVFPATGRRLSFTARMTGNGDEGRRIVLAGEITGTIWLDRNDRITRMEFPSSGLEAVRLRH